MRSIAGVIDRLVGIGSGILDGIGSASGQSRLIPAFYRVVRSGAVWQKPTPPPIYTRLFVGVPQAVALDQAPPEPNEAMMTVVSQLHGGCSGYPCRVAVLAGSENRQNSPFRSPEEKSALKNSE